MANADAPRGFQLRRHGKSAVFNGSDNGYAIASGYGTAIYNGDRVKLVSGKIQKAGVTEAAIGVFIGVKYTPAVGDPVNSPIWPASAATLGGVDAEALINDDLEQVFVAQFTNSTSVPAQADVGSYFNAYDAGGQAMWGISGQGVDYSTKTGTAASGVLQFVGFENAPDNDTSSAYSRGLFRFSNGLA